MIGTTVLAIIFNILSVVGVVVCLKHIAEVDNFKFVIFISTIHFFFTAIGTRVLLRINVFNYKEATFEAVLPLAAVCNMGFAFQADYVSYDREAYCRLHL